MFILGLVVGGVIGSIITLALLMIAIEEEGE